MKSNNWVLFLTLIVQGHLYASNNAEDDLHENNLQVNHLDQNGADIAKKCDRCHGTNGHSEKTDVPSIGGFSEFGIVDLLDSYRNGNRAPRRYKLPDGQETDMKEVSQSLTEDDAFAVAEHYARQVWQPHEQPFDAALAARGAQIHDIKCDKCHSEYGGVAEDDLAIMFVGSGANILKWNLTISIRVNEKWRRKCAKNTKACQRNTKRRSSSCT